MTIVIMMMLTRLGSIRMVDELVGNLLSRNTESSAGRFKIG